MLDLSIEQYNAYCEGYRYRCADDLANLMTAAYYNAYWNGASKSKRSLDSVLRKMYRELDKKKKNKPVEKMDVAGIKKDFERMEALRKYGWWQEHDS